ncbi:hypothetical protein KPH14_010337 [Odynerus spinipes]|uniref:Protein G12 n=1 Tax=Odynerus spinipes TaxID=1348599 RepID=A0AAD9VT27_9HYME|nr:hypothetical protein KPH14_010337 [Odynerus spinipes]
MKFALALIAIMATASAWEVPNLGKGDLYKDLQDFVDLVPTNKVVSIIMEYAAEDEEFQRTLEYLQSEEFKTLVQDVEALPEIADLMNYIYDAGVDIYYLVNLLNKFVGVPALTPPTNYKITGGLKGLVADLKAVIPFDKFEALYKEKLQTSKAFKEFVDRLSSPEFQNIVNTVYANPHFQNLLAKAKAAGLDLKVIKDLLYTLLGIKVPDHAY